MSMVEGDILPSHPTVIRVLFTSSEMYTLYENVRLATQIVILYTKEDWKDYVPDSKIT
jgi:hypothetical protein